MDRSRILVAVSMVVALLGLVERSPVFVPGIATPGVTTPSLRNGVGSVPGQAPRRTSSSAAAATLLATSAGAIAGAFSVRRRMDSKTARKADRDTGPNGLQPYGIVVRYVQSLEKAIAKKDESVAASKDMLRIKKLLDDNDWRLENTQEKIDEIEAPEDWTWENMETLEVSEAELMVSVLGPFESTCIPAFIKYLGKRQRIKMLSDMVDQYVDNLYQHQSVEPVLIETAQPLSDDQIEKIKTKMKAKMNCKDVKLVVKDKKSLMAGFKIYWNFMSPDTLGEHTEELDFSLRTKMEQTAVDTKGVPI